MDKYKMGRWPGIRWADQNAKLWQIVIQELYVLIGRKSFWIELMVVPVIGYLAYGGYMYYSRHEPDNKIRVSELINIQSDSILEKIQVEQQPLGYVDQANMIQSLPESVDSKEMIWYEDETQAMRALKAKEIRGYYVIDTMYPEGGPLRYYTDKIDILNFMKVDPVMYQAIYFNLLGENESALQAYQNPIQSVKEVNLSTEARSIFKLDPTSPIKLYLQLLIVITFSGSIVNASALMLNSFNRESQNRVMEVILSSVNVKQVLWGKLISLSLVGILSLLFWGANAAVVVRLLGVTVDWGEILPAWSNIIRWGIVFAALSYLFYGTILMGVGTLVPYLREAKQVNSLLSFPVMLPYFFIMVFAEEPNSAMPMILSFFPFTAPTAMLIRMLYSTVPTWQLVVSNLILLVSTAGVIALVAHFYRPSHLLNSPNIPLLQRIFKTGKRAATS